MASRYRMLLHGKREDPVLAKLSLPFSDSSVSVIPLESRADADGGPDGQGRKSAPCSPREVRGSVFAFPVSDCRL